MNDTHALVSNEYREAIKRIRDNPLFTYMVYRQPMLANNRNINDVTDTELRERDIAHDDESPTSTFMMACSAQFAALEKANPQYADHGFRAIGTIAQAMLAVRKEARGLCEYYFQLSGEALDARLSAGEKMSEIMADEMDKKIAEREKHNG